VTGAPKGIGVREHFLSFSKKSLLYAECSKSKGVVPHIHISVAEKPTCIVLRFYIILESVAVPTSRLWKLLL
jgi:hypothetical protein